MSDSLRVPRSLPRGRSHLPREVVLVSQRARLIEATVEVVGTKGYSATTVADIIKAAGVSRTTFYEQFADKESCFLAAYDETARRNLEQVVDACGRVRAPMARLQVGIRAFLEPIAGQMGYARVFLVEVFAAGPAGAAARAAVHDEYARLLRSWHQDVRAEDQLVPAMPDEVFDCAVGGVADFLAREVSAGAADASAGAADAREAGAGAADQGALGTGAAHTHDADRLRAMAPVIVTFLLNAAAVPAGRDLAAALSASRARRA